MALSGGAWSGMSGVLCSCARMTYKGRLEELTLEQISPMDSQLSILAVAGALILGLLFLRRRKTSKLPYPPGPMVTDMPALDSWVHYQNWGKQYGPLIYVRNRNILIINELQVAIDLLETRARIYSDRESTPILRMSKMENLNWTFQRYGDKWRRNRRTFQQTYRQATIDRFHPTQYKEAQLFLRKLLTAPSDFLEHTMALSQRNIYTAVYGLDVGADHRIARTAAKAVEHIGAMILPGAFPLLAQFPWLQFLPSWFPGCGFKHLAKQLREGIHEMCSMPFDLAVDNLKSGKGSSLIADLAIPLGHKEEELHALKTMGLISALAGADTTGASISSFILTMILHPEVQAKGQAEIDQVVGTDRLPTFEDRKSLPFVESIYHEVMRLYPPLPLGVSHASIEDDVYRDYFIPKGCLVVPNIWAMNRDPERYSDPHDFRPERFLELPKGPFTSINDISAFGFGRRVCPGRYMADNSVWLAIASVLATLNLRRATDEAGNEIGISGEFTNVFFSHPKPYKCSIVPRSPSAKELILATGDA
ncbi:hypothetical protein D9757_006779 [Collybiopsis confluens]|uniref:Cytochrome P450 n=1 Tax=Collybiopsis confluens TaxID=2823264 RepID=A0A8H5HLZ3_9AGAR|nr:hypothetical protein D9757_006779 [Collybiopsis confluens]